MNPVLCICSLGNEFGAQVNVLTFSDPEMSSQRATKQTERSHLKVFASGATSCSPTHHFNCNCDCSTAPSCKQHAFCAPVTKIAVHNNQNGLNQNTTDGGILTLYVQVSSPACFTRYLNNKLITYEDSTLGTVLIGDVRLLH